VQLTYNTVKLVPTAITKATLAAFSGCMLLSRSWWCCHALGFLHLVLCLVLLLPWHGKPLCCGWLHGNNPAQNGRAGVRRLRQ